VTCREWLFGGRDIPRRGGGFYLVLWPLHVRIRNRAVYVLNHVLGYE
jgi:hypothetical protein